MSEGESVATMLESVRAEIRSAEHDTVALAERLRTLLRMEARLAAMVPVRGRPRKGDIIEMPTRVTGGIHGAEPEDIVA